MTYYYNGKPYVNDVEMWRKHFANMAMGKTRPNENGQYCVGHVQRDGKKSEIKMVRPVAAAIERAKSEMAMENERKLYKGDTYF
jgi:hypothetical protein